MNAVKFDKAPDPEQIREMTLDELTSQSMQQEAECDRIAAKLDEFEGRDSWTRQDREWAVRAKGALRFKRTAVRQMAQHRGVLLRAANQINTWNQKFVEVCIAEFNRDSFAYLVDKADTAAGFERNGLPNG